MHVLKELKSHLGSPPFLTACLKKGLSLKTPFELKQKIFEAFERYKVEISEEVIESVSSDFYNLKSRFLFAVVNSNGGVFKSGLWEGDEFTNADNFPKLLPFLFYRLWFKKALLAFIERKKAEIYFLNESNFKLLNFIQDDIPNRVKYGGRLGFEENKIRRHIEHHELEYLKALYDFLKETMENLKAEVLLISVRDDFLDETSRVFVPRDNVCYVDISIDEDESKKLLKMVSFLKEQFLRRGDENLNRKKLFPISFKELLDKINSSNYPAEVYLSLELKTKGFYCPKDIEISLDGGKCNICGQNLLMTENFTDVIVFKLLGSGTDVYFTSSKEPLFFALY